MPLPSRIGEADDAASKEAGQMGSTPPPVPQVLFLGPDCVPSRRLRCSGAPAAMDGAHAAGAGSFSLSARNALSQDLISQQSAPFHSSDGGGRGHRRPISTETSH